MVAVYCQEHHHHTISLKTVVQHETHHEIPKKVKYHHHEEDYKAPVQTHEVRVIQAAPKQGQAVSSQSTVHQNVLGNGHEQINQIQIGAPIHYSASPKEPAPVHEVAVETPVVQYNYVPVVPVHVIQQASHQKQKAIQSKETHHQASHQKESDKEHHYEHHVDYYVS